MVAISYDKISINAENNGPFPYTFPIDWGKICLDLPLFEDAGPVVNDLSRYHHQMTITGTPLWSHSGALTVLDFGGAVGYLQCPAANSTALNFTNEDFTLVAWVYMNIGMAGAGMIMTQGAVNVDGWEWYVFNGSINLRTNQGGSHTGIGTDGSPLTFNAWHLIGTTRVGTACQHYIDGLPVAMLAGSLTDPVSCAGGNKFLIGVQNNEITNLWDGMMGRPRVWSRDIGADSMWDIFAKERSLYGV